MPFHRSHRAARSVLLVLGAGAWAVTGCSTLDTVEQVKDLRVLAVRLDPPEVMASFFHTFPPEDREGFCPLGPYGVAVRVLAVDPRGNEVQVSTRLCPDAESNVDVCRGYRIRDQATAGQVHALLPFMEPREQWAQADQAVGGEVPLATWDLAFPEEAMDYMLTPRDGEGVNFFACLMPSSPEVIVRARLRDGAEEVVALKRFIVSLDLWSDGYPDWLRDLLEQYVRIYLGMEFCPPDTDPRAEVPCIKRRVPNRNPSLDRVLFKHGAGLRTVDNPEDPTWDGQMRDLTTRIRVKPGGSVRLRPVVGSDDREPYQSMYIDIQDHKFILANYQEFLVFNWYTTTGTIQSQTSESSLTAPTADAVYTVSEEAPPGPAYVWVTVYDQRGGMDWRRVDFEVLEP